MKKIIYTSTAPNPIGPYNQAVLWQGKEQQTLYTSGQIAINPKTGELETESLEKETHLVMKNLEEVLKAAGMNFNDVVKTSIFLSDMKSFAVVNKIYGGYFNEEDAPARETVEVANLPKFVNVEISAIAIRG
ncbi:Rid family detoxifying hydrolase [Nonlabens antarcticus]|uniref:Rid family detoxifying hydrolase n=1 Tax=Nonlabens antarcticus TaxID=392714 RepID=UPI0018915F12|nr:Rid family detoxifying hydrolase [Nonlabens antarcticus]